MNDLVDRIEAGNNASFYFLSDADHPDVAMILSAMANSVGGQLLLGVKSNGKILGIVPEIEMEKVSSIIDKKISPELIVRFEKIQNGHHLLLGINVGSDEKKFKCLRSDGSRKYYVSGENGILEANKIVQSVWKMDQLRDDSKNLGKAERSLISLIKAEGPITLSQIYKRSELPMKQVDLFLSRLVYLKEVKQTMGASSMHYTAD